MYNQTNSGGNHWNIISQFFSASYIKRRHLKSTVSGRDTYHNVENGNKAEMKVNEETIKPMNTGQDDLLNPVLLFVVLDEIREQVKKRKRQNGS